VPELNRERDKNVEVALEMYVEGLFPEDCHAVMKCKADVAFRGPQNSGVESQRKMQPVISRSMKTIL